MGRSFKLIVLLALAVFGLGLGACLLGEDTTANHCAQADASHQCAVSCVCQTPSLAPAAMLDGPAVRSEPWRQRDHPLRLTLFADLIFQPPKA